MNALLEFTLAPIFIMLCISMWSILSKFPVQWAFAKEYWYLYVTVVGGLSALAFRNARGRWPRKCRALEELLQHGTLGREAVHRFFSSSEMSPEAPVARPVNTSIIFSASIIVPAMIAIVGRGGLFVFLSFVSSALVAYFLTTMQVRHFYMRRALSMRPVLQESPV